MLFSPTSQLLFFSFNSKSSATTLNALHLLLALNDGKKFAHFLGNILSNGDHFGPSDFEWKIQIQEMLIG